MACAQPAAPGAQHVTEDVPGETGAVCGGRPCAEVTRRDLADMTSQTAGQAGGCRRAMEEPGQHPRSLLRCPRRLRPSLRHREWDSPPSPLTPSRTGFHVGYFRRETVAVKRKEKNFHRKHEKEGSWHVGTRIKGSVRLRQRFDVMFLGQKPLD